MRRLRAVLLTGYLGGVISVHSLVAWPAFETPLPAIVGRAGWAGLYPRDGRLRAWQHRSEARAMQKITTFLTYNDQAEAAVKLYTSLFPRSRVVRTTRYGAGAPGPKGSVMTIAFELEGQSFVALNGGPSFSFSQGISLCVNCETQAELDLLWDGLSAGGKPVQCGWLVDRFGVSWQIVPATIVELVGDPDPAKAKRTMDAMLKMVKLDIAALQRAHDGA